MTMYFYDTFDYYYYNLIHSFFLMAEICFRNLFENSFKIFFPFILLCLCVSGIPFSFKVKTSYYFFISNFTQLPTGNLCPDD